MEVSQIQGQDRFLPDLQQSLHIEFQQFQEIALGCKRDTLPPCARWCFIVPT